MKSNDNFDSNNREINNFNNDDQLVNNEESRVQDENYRKQFYNEESYKQNTDYSREINNGSQENLKGQKDFFLPTTFEDYIVFSKNFYAGFWLRLIAFAIDMLVIISITGLFNTITFNILNVNLNIPLLSSDTLSYVIVMFSYMILMTYYFSQTLGKMIMKVKVETNKGNKLTFVDVLYREVVGRLLNIALLNLSYLSIAFTAKKKGLHDYITDTVVVKEDFSNIRRQMNIKLENLK